MARSMSFFRTRGLLSLSRARRGKELPVAWRLWTVSLIVVAVGPSAAAFGLPALGLVAILLTWECLHQQASSYAGQIAGSLQSTRRERVLDFGAGILIAAAFLVMTIVTLNSTLGSGEDHLGALVLGSSALGLWLAWRAFSLWWRLSYALVAIVVLTIAGSAGIWLAQTPVAAPTSTVAVWWQSLLRLLPVFLAAGIIEQFGQRRLFTRWSKDHLTSRLLETLAFVGVLAVLAPRPGIPGQNNTIDTPLWLLLIIGLTAATASAMSRATVPILRDQRWFSRLIRGGWATSGTVPAGIVVASAFLPAVGLCSIGSWTAWTIVFALGVAAALLKAINNRLDRRARITAPAARRKTPSGEGIPPSLEPQPLELAGWASGQSHTRTRAGAW